MQKLKKMNAKQKMPRRNNTLYTGLAIVLLGVLWLLRQAGVPLPGWLLSWEMILILIGLALGASSNFRNPASYILIGIGGFFLLNDLLLRPLHITHYFWPLVVIAVGLVIILRPRKHRKWQKTEPGDTGQEGEEYGGASNAGGSQPAGNGPGEQLDSVSIFNGIKRMVRSQNFCGGETVTIFGGTELNLLHADIQQQVVLDATVIFGGLKLIVPKGWDVRPEVTSILGGVEDKRFSAVEVIPDNKTLIISGTLIFGGIDIVSY